MEKVKFWKNTSSEFDKITSKDANTIYYLTDKGKIYLGEKMYGGTDMPFTLIDKADTKFASIDTMYSYDAEASSPKRNVENGLYLLKEDMDFSAKHTLTYYEYVILEISGNADAADPSKYLRNWTFTIPKGSTISVQDTFVFILCPNDVRYDMRDSTGSTGSSARVFKFGVLNGENTVSSLCIVDNGLESEYNYYDAILYNIFSSATEGGHFSKGQPIVTANSSEDNAIPLFKLGEAGATTTSITDDNYTNYTTTEKLSKLTAGLYYVNTDKLSVNLKGIDIKSQISTLFPQTNVDDTISVEKGSQITVTVEQTGSPETGYQKQKLVNIYNTTQGFGYPYSIFFVDAENNPNQALVSMGTDLINTALSYSYSAANQLGEIMNTCITDESLRGKVPVISAPDEQTATGVKNVFKAMDFPKGVPITTINTTNKSEFTTLKGILNHPDGMYLVDDCGVTNGDPQITIAPFKGHCSTVLMVSIAQFQQVMDSEEISCYKGSTIYILTGGDISEGAARYVSICNVPAGVSGEGSASSPDRTFPNAGTSVFRIEVHSVEDRSHYPITYSYDIDGGTETYFTAPTYESLFSSYANSLVAGSVIGGADSRFSPGQLIKVVENKDAPFNSCVFTGVDASEFKSPFTVITNENATNYNTLDKLCHLDDGLYLCKDTYKTNQDYIVDITFKGINLADATTASFTGTPPTPDTNGDTKCKNGAIISVVTQTGSTRNKIVRITHGLSANIDLSRGQGFEDIYIVAKPDNSSTDSNLVYGVTGENVEYYRPFGANAIFGSLLPFTAMSSSLMGGSVNGTKMAVWNRPEGSDMPTLGFADMPTSSNDKIQENESTSVVLNNHTEYRCKVMASLNLALPETIPDDYNSRIIFESGETATTLSYTAGSIKFTGDDCDSSNAFIPAASTSYEVDIKYLGLDSSGNKRIIARVGAF